MSDPAETKVCPLCAETIKAAAKLCPFCQTRQGGFSCWDLHWAPAFSGACCLVLTMVGFVWLLPSDKGRSFGGHRGELEVVRPAWEHEQRNYSLSGYVTNRGTYPWRVHAFEIRFEDQTGLVDVRDVSLKETFVVPPHSENAFRIIPGVLTYTNDSIARNVRVKTATDGNLTVKPD